MPNLNDFLLRIQTDHAYYLQFRRNPEEALRSYELSSDERTALTESGERLRAHVGQPNSYWKTNCSYLLLGPGELEFEVAAALGRPEVRTTLGEIRKASMESDRLTSVLALMEQIG